jgi:Zn-dependent M16 (insulinase) family peptidase
MTHVEGAASSMPILATAVALGFEKLPVFAGDKDVGESLGASEQGVLGANGIQAWRHIASGVRLVKFNAPGPLVSLSIFVGTEPVSDAGEPHTLEHLIFMSSKRHPQRGYLDTCAGLALCSGTNAFTANEYTSYTATTAGVEGFVNLLPCYLDHVLRPRLSKEAFASEVYRVKSDGSECGVVFSEMQAREHTEGDIIDREIRKALLGGTPLAMEAGGLCDSIRRLTHGDIQRFHARHYCGANVSLAIGGSHNIPIESLLKSAVSLLDEYAAEPGFSRGQIAWQSPLELQPMTAPIEQYFIRFPSADEDIGSVCISWRGPSCQEVYQNLAVNILLRYLSGNTASHLKQMFVMTEDPMCSDIDFDVETYRFVSTISLVCQGVSHFEDDDDDDEIEEIADSHNTFKTGVEEAVNGNGYREDEDVFENECESLLESGRVGTMVIEALEKVYRSGKLPGGVESVRASVSQRRDEYLENLEGDAHETIAHSLVEELIYGEGLGIPIGSEARGELERLRRLESEDEAWWLQLLNDVLLCSPRVEHFFIPDQELAESHAAEEARLVQERFETIGVDALHDMDMRSEEMLLAVKPCVDFAPSSFASRPSTENIPRLSYSVSVTTPGTHPWHGLSIGVDSSLVHATIYISTDSLSFEQKMCLPLLTEFLLKLDLHLDDGSHIPYTQSTQAISEATVDTDATGTLLGRPSRMHNECFGISYAAKPEKFDNATDLVIRALFHGVLTSERLSSVSKNAASDLTECMRDGTTVLDGALNILPTLLSGQSDVTSFPNSALVSLFGKQELIHFVAEEYSREKPRLRTRRKLTQLITSTLKALRAETNVFVQITARAPEAAHETISKYWTQYCWRPDGEEEIAHPSPIHVKPSKLKVLSKCIGSVPVGRAIGIQGVDGCFLDVRVDSNIAPGHVDWAAVQVLSQMLSRCEGPLYTAVRGGGFAYGVSLGLDPWMRMMYLGIHEASAPVSAWSALCAKLSEFRRALDDGTVLLLELDTAKSMTLFDLVNSRSTPLDISAGVFACCVQKLPAGEMADRILEDEVERVDLTAIRHVFDAHVARLLVPESRMALMTCGTTALDKNIADFRTVCENPIEFQPCDVEDLSLPQVSRMVAGLCRSSR